LRNRRDIASRLPDLADIAKRLESLQRSRPAIPVLYVEFAHAKKAARASRERDEAEHKRAIAVAVRSSLGAVLRKGDIAAAGPGAQWFIVLLVARARRTKAEISDADLGVAAERLRRAVQWAMAGRAESKATADGALRCGWTVLELDGTSSLAALRQAVRGAAVVARIEERRALTLAAVTHELRTPLTAIVGFAERLRDHRTKGAARARAAEVIADEAQRLVRLTEGLIDIGAWTAGHLSLRLQACDVAAVAKAAVESVAERARQKKVRMRVFGRARIIADRDRCFQVILNLLDNAVRHSPERSSVEVAIDRHERRCTIRVSDGGPGFAPAVRTALGRPFTRGVDGRVGLGLAISKVLIEAHGGSLEAPTGGRSEVVVTLPQHPAGRRKNNPAGPNKRL